MILRWARIVIVLLLFYFTVFVHPPISLANNDSHQQAYLQFENRIFDIINNSMEPFNHINESLDEDSLYEIVLSAKEKFGENSLTITKLKVPNTLPNDIKTSLEHTKGEFSTGFKSLKESMSYFAQYIVNRAPASYDKFIEKRHKGFLYINGGLTSLATIRMQLNAPNIKPFPNAWKVGRRKMYQLENNLPHKAVPIKSGYNQF